MLVADRIAPHKSVSRDQSRPILARVVLNIPPKPRKKAEAWTGALTATDSYQAVKIPVTFTEDDSPKAGVYLIEPEAFKDPKAQRYVRGDKLVLSTGQTFDLQTDKGQPFDFDKFLPERETAFEIGFNIDVLRAACEGMGHNGTKQYALRFTLDGAGDPNALRPMLVRPLVEDGDDGRIALVMPVRIQR